MKRILSFVLSFVLSFALLSGAVSCAPSAQPATTRWDYPATKTVDAADTYFGQTYKDPYRLQVFQASGGPSWLLIHFSRLRIHADQLELINSIFFLKPIAQAKRTRISARIKFWPRGITSAKGCTKKIWHQKFRGADCNGQPGSCGESLCTGELTCA